MPYSNAAQGRKPSAEEHHQRTLLRIKQIQSHLSNSPRGQRLKGKTCVITGVGSLHGIGWILSRWFMQWNWPVICTSRASALLFAHEGPWTITFWKQRPSQFLSWYSQERLIYTCSISHKRTFLNSSQRLRTHIRMWRWDLDIPCV